MPQLNDFQTTRPSMLWLEFDVFRFSKLLEENLIQMVIKFLRSLLEFKLKVQIIEKFDAPAHILNFK